MAKKDFCTTLNCSPPLRGGDKGEGEIFKRRFRRGASTIAAIMMIIILGILGAAFVSLLGTENYGYFNEYESAQSFYNANAGVEWGLKQRASTASPITFAGGTISVSVVGNALTATGATNYGGERVMQVTLPAVPGGETSPAEGCSSFTIADNSSYSPYTTAFTNPVGGVGDIVYVKVKSTTLARCSGGVPTLNTAEITIENIKCPNNSVQFSTVSNWSCSGPTTGGGCTNYYEYMIGVTLPASWTNTSASLYIRLQDPSNEFRGQEVITIGSGDCSSVKFYSDSGYATEVTPWEFKKGSTYYMRVITNNLSGAIPNNNARLRIRDFSNNTIFNDSNFFSRNGTRSITCSGSNYTYASYEGSFTVPNSAPAGGSDWNSEPTADWNYNFEVRLEANGVGCQFNYRNTLKILAASGGGPNPNPLDEAASQASATKSTPSTPDWHGAAAGSDQFIIKLINETSSSLVITGFSLSCSTSQPQLRHIQSMTPANGWNKQTIWDGPKALPTGLINVNLGAAVDWTIPPNGYIILDDVHFQSNMNPGTFTFIIYFQGGTSSTLTFTL